MALVLNAWPYLEVYVPVSLQNELHSLQYKKTTTLNCKIKTDLWPRGGKNLKKLPRVHCECVTRYRHSEVSPAHYGNENSRRGKKHHVRNVRTPACFYIKFSCAMPNCPLRHKHSHCVLSTHRHRDTHTHTKSVSPPSPLPPVPKRTT